MVPMQDNDENTLTDANLLELALRGGETEWEQLHKLCLDRGAAERLGRMLERNAAGQAEVAEAWAAVLEELHPGLKVNLPR